MKKFFCAFLMLLAVASSYAEVAFIDMKHIFDNYYKTKDSDATLTTQREAMKAIAENMMKDLEEMRKNYMKLREEAQNVILSKEQREAKFAEMKRVEKSAEDKKTEIEQYQKSSITKIRTRYEEVRDSITKELLEYLSKFAEKKGYDMILDVSGQTANGISSVVYYNKKKDITTAIIKRLNAGNEESDKEEK